MLYVNYVSVKIILVVRYTQHKISHPAHLKVYSSVWLYTFMLCIQDHFTRKRTRQMGPISCPHHFIEERAPEGKQGREAGILCVYACVHTPSQSVVFDFSDPLDCSPPGSYCPWNFPGKDTGMGSLILLQGIFLTQGSNPCLHHWQADSLPVEPVGKPSWHLDEGCSSRVCDRKAQRKK